MAHERRIACDSMAPRIVESMSSPQNEYVLMRAEDGTVAAVAQWTVSLQGAKNEKEGETPDEKAERLKLWDQGYRSRLPENSNKDLIIDFTIGLRELRESVLRGREHFLLENIATHPNHRGNGLASQLIRWVFPQADKQGALVYLDTASDNAALRLYKKLGFQEEGSDTIKDLTKYGGEGEHTHVALLRLPYS
ncbi:uncharacterized protein N0V89_000393 [Didymosphaeria variabile]|uniref:N-acetyltransferase domain-containing protein n=1 Tax=Didymosphaeria variabile TaxID=1932322 RepID=A0A9W9CFP6_9PLEO|nr:uncharacterized protein N0V89_000393 [Didymosphaeria variabile]KAJ4359837.1 hypothetical protein N0V89_000393 [Didymosphaeria variabile]